MVWTYIYIYIRYIYSRWGRAQNLADSHWRRSKEEQEGAKREAGRKKGRAEGLLDEGIRAEDGSPDLWAAGPEGMVQGEVGGSPPPKLP